MLQTTQHPIVLTVYVGYTFLRLFVCRRQAAGHLQTWQMVKFTLQRTMQTLMAIRMPKKQQDSIACEAPLRNLEPFTGFWF